MNKMVYKELAKYIIKREQMSTTTTSQSITSALTSLPGYTQQVNLGDYGLAGPDITSGPSKTSTVDDSILNLSVPFLTLNILGTGIVLFVGNLWSEVFSQWLTNVQESNIFFQDSDGNVIQADDSTQNKNIKRGFWVALIATIIAIFLIWAMITFYNSLKKEWVVIKSTWK